MTDSPDRRADVGSYPPPAAGDGEPSWASAPPAEERARLNPLAVVSLIAGLLGLGLAAVVLGHVALVQTSRAGERGRGLAVAGLVLGYLGVVAWVVGWFVYSGFVGGLRDGGYLPA